MDPQTRWILSILSIAGEHEAAVSRKHMLRYLAYLQEELAVPFTVTGREDMGSFAWEEYYLLGPGNQKEYEKQRRTKASFQDRYILTSLDDEPDDEGGIVAVVQRISDKKEFVLFLVDLKAVEKKSNNAQLLDDYSFWQVNFSW